MLLSEWDADISSGDALAPVVAEAPQKVVDSKPLENDIAELTASISKLKHEISKLREQNRRTSTLNWIVLAIIALLIIVCLGTCHQATKQLHHAVNVMSQLSYVR